MLNLKEYYGGRNIWTQNIDLPRACIDTPLFDETLLPTKNWRNSQYRAILQKYAIDSNFIRSSERQRIPGILSSLQRQKRSTKEQASRSDVTSKVVHISHKSVDSLPRIHQNRDELAQQLE